MDRKFRSRIEDRTAAIRYADQMSKDILQIYTDGSKQGKLTGAGFSAVRPNREVYNKHYSLGTIASVFQCELFAIHMGCAWSLTELSDSYYIAFSVGLLFKPLTLLRFIQVLSWTLLPS
jgi:hypothetical protein